MFLFIKHILAPQCSKTSKVGFHDFDSQFLRGKLNQVNCFLFDDLVEVSIFALPF